MFRLLIDECDFLIDDRAYERCEHASLKEQFSIKIDSIRKSLGIENMEDVDILVNTFYGFEAKYQREQDEKWLKEQRDLEAQALEQGLPMQPLNHKEDLNVEESTQKNPTQLTLNADHIVLALDQFHQDREDKAI